MIENAKAPVAALTMVRGEDFFLKRWLAYYRQFLPDEHIYVLNHGGDPEVAEIAQSPLIKQIEQATDDADAAEYAAMDLPVK